jgi:ABC-2 type transport system ATP-binding protein
VVAIEVVGLTKTFRVHQREAGLRASLRSVLRRSYVDVDAVAGIDFTIAAGEIVGFLGPNGAGKTTTLKCLSGLLHPTSGQVRVLGREPHRREQELLRSISLVLGQRSSLLWDLPAADAFEVNKAIYGIDDSTFHSTMAELIELLDIGALLKKQVRTLSLGERMRCELAGALAHRPSVLFLDEPTLGLDVNGQAAIREFVRDYNERHGATVLLTSHYMADVTALTERVIVIDHGRLRFDGHLDRLVRTYSAERVIRLTLGVDADAAQLERYGRVESTDGALAVIRVERERSTETVGLLLADLPVEDVAIEEPPIEDVIRTVFAGP